ncbi:coatomer subunit beta-1-like [Aegilops tauschii subsp. strangulata]|uniref:coatomer subunit beta-1-like n=1 Tax=Aegilops tauschii subsp. strangulata TaxID=200361 RepID=UPI003CC8DC31
MGEALESPCTLLLPFLHKSRHWTAEKIRAGLEGSDVGAKVEALKRAIILHHNGDTAPHLLITVVHCVLPSKENIIQRLLLVYLEVVDKQDQASGKVIPEMILLSHHLRNNLQHPNEYIRGVMLRFLCRLHEPELLQLIVPAIAISSTRTLSSADTRSPQCLSPSAFLVACSSSQTWLTLCSALAIEQDPSARRNTFLMLCDCSPDHANAYLLGNAARVGEWPVSLQMAALDFVREVYSPRFRTKYIEIIMSLISTGTTDAAVVYEYPYRNHLAYSSAVDAMLVLMVISWVVLDFYKPKVGDCATHLINVRSSSTIWQLLALHKLAKKII